MSICNSLTTGLNKSCENNAGGVAKIYVTDFENVTAFTVGTASAFPTNDGITAITTSGDFFEIQTNKNVCDFSEKVAINLDNGSTYFEQTVNIVLSRRDSAKRDFIEKLVVGQKQLALIVQDSNSLFWYIGKVEGGYVTAIESTTGVKKADGNSYKVTIMAMENAQAYQVDPTLISSLI
jgi:hypothetical protein